MKEPKYKPNEKVYCFFFYEPNVAFVKKSIVTTTKDIEGESTAITYLIVVNDIEFIYKEEDLYHSLKEINKAAKSIQF
jgi:hypothetical protein